MVAISSVGKEPACKAGDHRSIPGSGRSTGEGIGYPLQYSGLENSMSSIVHGFAKSETQLSDFHTYVFDAISKKALLNPHSQRFAPISPPKSFVVLALTFRPTLHLG